MLKLMGSPTTLVDDKGLFMLGMVVQVCDQKQEDQKFQASLDHKRVQTILGNLVRPCFIKTTSTKSVNQ